MTSTRGNFISQIFFRFGMLLAILLPACLCCSVTQAAEPFLYDVRIDVQDQYLKLLEDNLDILRWRSNPRMNVDQLRRIYARTPDDMRQLLAAEGYYQPRIEATLEQRNSGWLAAFRVVLDKPVVVDHFAIRLAGPLMVEQDQAATLLAKMRASWLLPAGQTFRQADWEAAKRKALQMLIVGRYPSARVATSQATVDAELHRASLELVLDSGPAFSFGELEISGLQRYPREIVERLSPIKPGEPYSQRALLDFQARLQDSHYFSSAVVTTETDPAHPLLVPVKIVLSEMQTRKVGFGLGYSTNTGDRATVDYQDLNLKDLGWQLHSTLKLESKSQSVNGEIQFPLKRAGYRDSVNAGYTRTSVQGETTQSYVTGGKRVRSAGDIETAVTLQYQMERQSVAGIGDNNVQALTPGYSWTQRKVDDVLFPTRGYFVNWQITGAHRAVLSDRNFIRGYGKAAWFHPVGARSGLMLKGELGAVVAKKREDIPSDFLFRAGGDQSVRGYAYQSLGVNLGGAIVGGRYLGVASAEYTHWLTSSWGAAVFYDVGNAVDNWRDNKAVQGYGVGARWKSPVGPLNLDLAYGREVRKIRLHFSVGFPF